MAANKLQKTKHTKWSAAKNLKIKLSKFGSMLSFASRNDKKKSDWPCVLIKITDLAFGKPTCL